MEADVWSVTSFTELRRDGLEARARQPPASDARAAQARTCEECLGAGDAPVVAATDYLRTLPDLIRPWVSAPYTVLGTDGFGRSDYRRALRRFFEVDRHHVVRRRAARARAPRGRREGDRQVRDRRGGGGAMAAVGTPRDVTVPDIGDFVDVPVIEILVEARQTRGRGGPARRAGVRQGDDGGARAVRGRRVGAEGGGRRQGVGGLDAARPRRRRGQRRERAAPPRRRAVGAPRPPRVGGRRAAQRRVGDRSRGAVRREVRRRHPRRRRPDPRGGAGLRLAGACGGSRASAAST